MEIVRIKSRRTYRYYHFNSDHRLTQFNPSNSKQEDIISFISVLFYKGDIRYLAVGACFAPVFSNIIAR